jgi:WD40 repeat protein
LDAIVHRPTGNIVLAMGNRGVLVRTTEAQWRWVPVGTYYRGEQTPAPITPQVMQFPTPTPDPPSITPRATWKADTLFAFVVTFSPDGKSLATGSRNEGIQLWNAADGKLLRTLEKQKGWVYALAFSPDGQTLASSDSNTDPVVRLYRVADGAPIRVLSDAGGVMGFSPDGQTLATNTVQLWRVSDGSSLRTLSGHPERGVTSAAFSPDSKLFATGDAEGTVRLWRVADGTLLWTRKAEGPGDSMPIFAALTDLAFSADGQTLSSVQGNLTLWQWRVADGSLLRAMALPGPHGCYAFVSAFAFSPDGRILATAVETERVWLWRVEDGTPLGTSQLGSQVRSVSFSPDGAILASAETDGSVRLWDVPP